MVSPISFNLTHNYRYNYKHKQPRQKVATIARPQVPAALVERPDLVVEKTQQEDLNLWWPAGSEFDTTAAVPVSEIDLEAILPEREQLSHQAPTPVISALKLPQTDTLAQEEEQRWWSVGQKFGPNSAHADGQFIQDEDC